VSHSKSSKKCCIPATNNDVVEIQEPLSDINTHDGMKRVNPTIETSSIGGDWFMMGSTDSSHPEDGESPVRSVWVDEFRLSTTAVSNKDFHRFVDATGYVTDAQRAGSSFVFYLLIENAQTHTASGVAPWWLDVRGASWCHPEGPGSTIEDRGNHPVVHVTRHDALRYCQWAGARLPTEAQWEYAARGGMESKPYPWGAELMPQGRHHCNIWQGDFPSFNDANDGFIGTAPVNEYAANAYGLFNMTGNVWEWTADRFTNMHSPRSIKNPAGPLNGDQYVAKGGSYLCHASYCLRYRTSSRQALDASVSTGNVGFRVSLDAA